jgi:hypothetical protein
MGSGFSDIVIVCPGESSRVGSTLRNKDIPLSVVPDPPLAEILTTNMESRLLIVELTNDIEACKQLAEALCQSSAMSRLPIIVVGTALESGEDHQEVERIFKDFNLLSKSGDSLESQLTTALNKSFEDYYQPNKLPESSSTGLIKYQSPEIFDSPDRLDPHFSQLIKKPLPEKLSKFIRAQFDPKIRYNGCLNGDKYIMVQNPSALVEKEYLPKAGTYAKLLKSLEEDCSRWELAHFHRTSFITFNILKSLDLGDKGLELAKACSMLYNFPNGIGRESVTKATYIRKGQTANRGKIAEAIQENALFFEKHEELMQLAPIMTALSRLIAESPEIEKNPSISKITSALLLADVIDRECWQGSNWDVTGGHTVMKWIEASEGAGFDPSVACQTIRFLVETFEATPPEQMISNKRW